MVLKIGACVSVLSVSTVGRSGGEIFQSVDAAGPLGSSAGRQALRQKNIRILTRNNDNDNRLGGGGGGSERPSERAQSPAVSVPGSSTTATISGIRLFDSMN